MVKEQKHICLFGASGSGKTHEALKLIKSSKRVIAFDPVKEFGGFIVDLDRATWKHRILTHVKKNWSKGYRISLQGGLQNPSQFGHDLWELLKRIQDPYLNGKAKAKIVLVIEEADRLVPVKDLPASRQGLQKEAPMRGRHFGVDMIVLTQRPQMISKDVQGNALIQKFFALADIPAQTVAAQILGGTRGNEKTTKEWMRAISNLTKGQHFEVKDRKVTAKGPGITERALPRK